jgi:hypothetical protein
MKILIRHHPKDKWSVVESATYNAENELQKLLAESPSLISIDEIRDGIAPLVVAVREIGLPGSGSTDIVAFNATGDIAVIECKLAANAEIKRKVIGQVLEYGSYLWGMTYDQLDSQIKNRIGTNLADLVRAKVVDSDEWDEEEFRRAIAATLTDGTFILVIAVDEMNPELSRTVRFLNNCGNPAFAFAALEIRRFHSGTTEILVPDVLGQDTKPTNTSTRTPWAEDSFFKSVKPELLSEIRGIYDWAKQDADQVTFGTGKGAGAFVAKYLRKDGKPVSVFVVRTNGVFSIVFGHIKSRLPESLVDEFRQAISAIPSLADVAKADNWEPRTTVDAAFVGKETSLKQFKDAVEILGKSIRTQEGPPASLEGDAVIIE